VRLRFPMIKLWWFLVHSTVDPAGRAEERGWDDWKDELIQLEGSVKNVDVGRGRRNKAGLRLEVQQVVEMQIVQRVEM
jgi:hypothetical protein